MSKRKVHIYTPDEKLKFSAMDSFERHQLALNSFDEGKSDPVAVALGQSARQQEELEVAKKREDALWALVAYGAQFVGQTVRGLDGFENLSGNILAFRDSKFSRAWMDEGQKLKARVLGTTTARPVRSKLGPHGSMAVNEMKKRQVDWIKESGRAMVEMWKMSPVTPVVGVGRGMRLSQRKKNRAAR